MSTRGRVRASSVAFTFGFVIALFVCGSASAQQKQSAPKLDKNQLQDAQALASALDAAESGQAAPTDFALAIESYHFFKTATGETYVPFTVTVDPQALTDPSVALMLRAVNRNAKLPATAEPGKKPGLPRPAYGDDLQFFALRPAIATPAAAQAQTAAQVSPLRFRRALQVPGGDYDVYLALKERNPADKKKPKISVCKTTISVPDFNGSELQTSSVMVSDKIAATTKALTPQERRENPYIIGPLEINPRNGIEFASTEELNVYFQIYNPALDAAKKPDVLVEFAFFQKQADGTEKKIANSEPQVVNATTLPPEFDVAKHQLVGGSAWPLSRFKPGNYRVDIKITDKLSGKILTRTASFSVS